jgi:hypothetical protein
MLGAAFPARALSHGAPFAYVGVVQGALPLYARRQPPSLAHPVRYVVLAPAVITAGEQRQLGTSHLAGKLPGSTYPRSQWEAEGSMAAEARELERSGGLQLSADRHQSAKHQDEHLPNFWVPSARYRLIRISRPPCFGAHSMSPGIASLVPARGAPRLTRRSRCSIWPRAWEHWGRPRSPRLN